jgi:hypothetical protein
MDEEDVQEGKRARPEEESHARFKESGRPSRGRPNQGIRGREQDRENAGKEEEELEDENGELVTNKIIKALVLLEERTRTIGERLERIKSRINKLGSSEGVGKVRPKTRPQR